MQKVLEIFLSILTAVGGFVEIGELVFAVDAGAKFGYSLLWVVLLGTVGIIVYGEMSGRIAAVTGVEPLASGRFRLQLAGGQVLTTGRSYREQVRRDFGLAPAAAAD
jgi:hypothetical protein